MAAQLLGVILRLKLALLGGAFRRSSWQLVGLVLALIYGAGLTVLVIAGLIAARFAADTGLVRDVVVVAGAAVTTGFLVLPLVFGVDDTLDPRKFALFGIRRSSLALGLAVAAVISVPAAVLLLCSLATVATWAHGAGTALLALLSALIGTAICLLGARVTTALASYLLSSRRARELTGVAGMLLVVMIAPVALSLANVDWNRSGLSVLRVLADILRWSPMGAAWSAPADAVRGHGASAALELLIAAASLLALWFAWRALVAFILVSPGRENAVRNYSGLGWFSAWPGTGWGAVAARSLTYWLRDPRYWVSLIMIPFIPAIVLGALLVVDALPLQYVALIPLPVMVLFLGWSAHNDVAYDGTAVWQHVVSGTTGLADRIGRLVPVLVIGVPLIVIGIAVSLYYYGDVRVLPAFVGVDAALLLSGLGISSITSALVSYPVPQPGSSPFQQPQSVGAAAALVQSLSLFCIIALSAPSIVFALLGVFGDPAWFLASLWAGVIVGLGAVVGGVAAGSAIFNARGPQLLAAAMRAA